ncbi:hypothetical protein [Pseudoxanthomonas putridarboris]|uniref:Secreted protein n=1 Tax=Pseudoxanthomonas putridarboris TaxID=752605 RepID=A0ABU9J3V4_9GAMM
MPRSNPLLSLVLSCALLVLAACAAPASSNGPSEALPPATSGTSPSKPMSSPYPPREVATPANVDYSCRSNADCAVKDVGNCCGAMPACVNKDSPTDPQAVQAQCAASGRMGICGFVDITACQCVSGRCEPDNSSHHLPVQ